MKRTVTYLGTLLPALIMTLAIAWLTVSLPFVYEAQQHVLAQQSGSEKQPADSEENCSALNSSNEEKVEGGGNTLSEYLHDTQPLFETAGSLLIHQHCQDAETYIAFHGELISPPPDPA